MSSDIKVLEKNIKVLTDNYTVKLEEIEGYPDINNSYSIINDKITYNKDDIIKLILKQYRPSQILPETVGSYLFGCFQQDYGDIPSECSPLCAYGIKNNDDLTLENCTNQIYIQYLDDSINSSPRFTKLGKSNSTQGLVFVKLNFIGFTTNEREYFRRNGIYKLQVLTTKDSKHHTILKMRSIDDIPIIEQKNGQSFLTSNNSMEEYSTEINDLLSSANSEDNNYLYVVLAVVIIGFILMATRNQ
jgi:hypothetical protein